MTRRLRSILDVSTTASTSTGLSGIFAKFVARFLVKWIKKTLGAGSAPSGPALTGTPSQVAGRPERDRSREDFGQHTGATGGRAFEDPGEARAIRGDDYGAHRGVLQDRPYRHLTPEQRRAAIWTGDDLQQQREALRRADPEVLRDHGLNDKQVAQCQQGRVPSGHLVDRIATNWVLLRTTPENQLLANSLHSQLVDIRVGETRILAIGSDGTHVVLVLGAAS